MQLVIVGDSGLARETAQLARALSLPGASNATFVSEGSEDAIMEAVSQPSFSGSMILGLGRPARRLAAWRRWAEVTSDAQWPALVHPRADVGDTTTLAAGAVVTSGVVSTTDVSIGCGTLLNLNTTIGHNAVIGDCCVINPGATISGGVVLGDGVLVGTGANILEGVQVGAGATIGAGALVTKDVDPGDIVVGLPARPRT